MVSIRWRASTRREYALVRGLGGTRYEAWLTPLVEIPPDSAFYLAEVVEESESMACIVACGFWIADGELGGVFNRSGYRGLGRVAVREAMQRGAAYLTCFDGFLTGYYAGMGWTVQEIHPFNPALAPVTWNAGDGQPGLVVMRAPLLERRGDGALQSNNQRTARGSLTLR